MTSEYDFDKDMDIGADEKKVPIEDEDIPMPVLKADEFWPLVCPTEDPPEGAEDPRVPLVPRYPSWVPKVLAAGQMEATGTDEWVARNQWWVSFEGPVAVSPPKSPPRIDQNDKETMMLSRWKNDPSGSRSRGFCLG